jgi:tRNA A-37 threonylcarbamoyl transferase component Bud32
MIEKVVEPILKNNENSIWIFCRYEFLDKFNKIFNNERVKIIPLQETIGAAETLFFACLYIPENQPFTSIDCDTIINEETEKVISKNTTNKVYTFTDKHKQGIFSYIVPNGCYISEIHEKNAVSEIASSGIYQFESPEKYIHIYEKMHGNIAFSNELYISNLIDFFVSSGELFSFKNIDGGFTCVGTPFQLEKHLKENKELKTFVFDLDRTLIYDTNENPNPIKKNVDFCNGLFEIGHKIIIHTARGMLSHNNDVELVKETYEEKVKSILEKNGIKYTELIFGKPYADIYIDDKAINAFDDLNKKAGFYSGVKFDTRFMHNIFDSGDKIIKSGKGVENEIFYYKEMPKELSKFFPKIYHSENENELVMEKIDGTSVSDLLLDLQLSKDNISKIVNSFKELHDHIWVQHEDDWLYKGKMLERFKENKNFYNKLGISENEVLELAENVKVSNHSIIHGDSVFTNIFINKKNEVKLIDPRGKNQNGYSICGASCYDYAKMLQSLYGYDFIINEANIPETYLSFVRDYFFSIIKEEPNQLKIKTKILVLSMLPLHIDRPDRILKFVELYRKIV